MPSHELHRAIDRKILKRAFEDVHLMLDLPGLYGMRGHRRFLHDIPSALIIGMTLHGWKGAASALLHLATDEACKVKHMERLLWELVKKR